MVLLKHWKKIKKKHTHLRFIDIQYYVEFLQRGNSKLLYLTGVCYIELLKEMKVNVSR